MKRRVFFRRLHDRGKIFENCDVHEQRFYLRQRNVRENEHTDTRTKAHASQKSADKKRYTPQLITKESIRFEHGFETSAATWQPIFHQPPSEKLSRVLSTTSKPAAHAEGSRSARSPSGRRRLVGATPPSERNGPSACQETAVGLQCCGTKNAGQDLQRRSSRSPRPAKSAISQASVIPSHHHQQHAGAKTTQDVLKGWVTVGKPNHPREPSTAVVFVRVPLFPPRLRAARVLCLGAVDARPCCGRHRVRRNHGAASTTVHALLAGGLPPTTCLTQTPRHNVRVHRIRRHDNQREQNASRRKQQSAPAAGRNTSMTPVWSK